MSALELLDDSVLSDGVNRVVGIAYADDLATLGTSVPLLQETLSVDH
jgi:hypothetical protein